MQRGFLVLGFEVMIVNFLNTPKYNINVLKSSHWILLEYTWIEIVQICSTWHTSSQSNEEARKLHWKAHFTKVVESSESS